MELILIAAVAANGVIGCHHTIPWSIPEDLAHFRRTTMGSPVLMGRATWASLPGPLPGRRMIVVSTSQDPATAGCTVVPSLKAALELCREREDERVFVIGGSQLYRAALPLADTLILTRIARSYPGDVFFPDFSTEPFVLISRCPLASAIPATIETYRRKTA
ncbi:MAG: dihydrofolate reductase [Desulfobulbus sp.]